jgi:hypothetical protein
MVDRPRPTRALVAQHQMRVPRRRSAPKSRVSTHSEEAIVPQGPKGERRPADVISNAVKVMRRRCRPKAEIAQKAAEERWRKVK